MYLRQPLDRLVIIVDDLYSLKRLKNMLHCQEGYRSYFGARIQIS